MTGIVVAVALVGVVVALLQAIARANPGGAAPTGSLVAPDGGAAAEPRPVRLVEWEALLLAGATSGRRGRERLGRQMERLVASALADGHGLSLDDPRAADLLGPEWRFLQGGPPPGGGGTDAAAIAHAVGVVLDRLEAGGPGRVR